MTLLRTLTLWLHTTSIITWFGGLVFYLLIADPVARAAGSARERLRALADLDQRFRHLIWGSVEFAVVTGIALLVITLFQAGTGVSLSGDYHKVLGVKLVLAVLIIAMQLWNHIKINPRKRALAEGAGEAGAAEFDALQARTRQVYLLELIVAAALVLLGVHLRAVL